MVVAVLLTVGLPVLVLGLRLAFHAVDPASYGPGGGPSVFQILCQPMAEFGFIIAATLGATAGTTDLADGMFRHLVITGRSLSRSTWPGSRPACRSSCRWSPWPSPSCAW